MVGLNLGWIFAVKVVYYIYLVNSLQLKTAIKLIYSIYKPCNYDLRYIELTNQNKIVTDTHREKNVSQ